MTPRALIVEALRLVEDPEPALKGAWARSAAVLARRALEVEMRSRLEAKYGRYGRASFQAQLIALREVLLDDDVGAEVGWAWSALSAATHHQAYVLPPTASELKRWIGTVQRLIEVE